MDDNTRVDSEWVALNAFRGLTKLATKGDMSKSTYDSAMELGGVLYPELLGPDASVLRRFRENDTTKEYRQRARLRSIREDVVIDPLKLVTADIDEIQDLLQIAKREKQSKDKVDQLKRRLSILNAAEAELNPVAHTENQLIFRDAYAVERTVPMLGAGQAFRDFELPDSNILRVRVLHPDKPEHITGTDIIYERHNPHKEEASIVAVQYKIWEDRVLYLNEPRMQAQLAKMKAFLCDEAICKATSGTENSFRFPCCAAFLRPTDKLQRADQTFISSGEHIPICRIDDCKSVGVRGSASVLEYKKMKSVSLSSDMFEQLFNKGKIGSRPLSHSELIDLYTCYEVTRDEHTVVIYAQEFSDFGITKSAQ